MTFRGDPSLARSKISLKAMTPFKVGYGRDPPKLLHMGSSHTNVDNLDELLQKPTEFWISSR